MKFGPLWDDPKTVINFLKKEALSEGHDAVGQTVNQFSAWLMENPYEASGEEIKAVIRLLQLNQSSSIIF